MPVPVEAEFEAEQFEAVVGAYRRELHAHCYLMLGSLADAEDAVQETLLAAWRGLGGFAGRSSVRTWLHRIATNTCLNLLRARGRRLTTEPLPPFDPPPPTGRWEAPWLQPYPGGPRGGSGDAVDPVGRHLVLESVEVAFVAALQTLPPRQVAVVVLCDVLGYPTGEAAAVLGLTGTAVKGLLQRARISLRRLSGGAPDAVVPGSATERELAARFARAYAADDVDGVLALLSDDAWLAMPPAPQLYVGRAAVGAFLAASAAGRGGPLRLVEVTANGRPGFGWYVVGPDGARLGGVVALAMAGGRISGIARFIDAGLAGPFGLPAMLAVG